VLCGELVSALLPVEGRPSALWKGGEEERTLRYLGRIKGTQQHRLFVIDLWLNVSFLFISNP